MCHDCRIHDLIDEICSQLCSNQDNPKNIFIKRLRSYVAIGDIGHTSIYDYSKIPVLESLLESVKKLKDVDGYEERLKRHKMEMAGEK